MTPQRTITEVTPLSRDALRRLQRALVSDLATQAARFAEHQAMASQLRGATDGDSVLERELAEAGASRARDAITDIEHALQRLQAGRYGSCEVCGSPIPLERLEAMPSTRFCVACPGRRPGWPL